MSTRPLDAPAVSVPAASIASSSLAPPAAAAPSAGADDLRREFLRTLAHSLRTRIGELEGGLVLLGPAVREESEEAETLRKLEETARELSECVERFVEFADREAEERRGPKGVELRAPYPLARHAIAAVSEIARARRVLISDRIPEGLAAVAVGSEDLTRALIQVLSSAIRFSPPGGVLALEGRAAEREVTIHFCLEGPGIPAALLEGAPGSEKSSSSGLGLILARQLLRENRGDLRAARPSGERGRIAQLAVSLPRA